MLPSTKRLSRQQVTDFLKNPEIKVVFNRLGTLKFLNQSNRGTFNIESGFSVVTSSKNQKKAVLRNKIRRQVYSLLQHKDISFTGILYVSKNAYNMSFDEIKHCFHGLLQKITQ